MVTRSTLIRSMVIAAALIAAAIGYGIKSFTSSDMVMTAGLSSSGAWKDAVSACYAIASLLVVSVAAQFLCAHKIWRGSRYAWHHWYILRRVRRQMKDAGYGIQRQYTVELPKLKLELAPDYQSGKLRIQNALKFNAKLDKIDMSAALGSFVVERGYQSDDANWHIYELLNGTTSYKSIFDSFEEFRDRANEERNNRVFLDARSVVKLQHTLVVGATGSGKTYALYSLILQMLNMRTPCELFYADPKNSSLAIIGEAVAPEHTATELSEIISLLGRFVDAMNSRKEELKSKLQNRVDADYSDFGLPAYVMVVDEYASFAVSLKAVSKEERDNANRWVHEIVLQGRQLGFFIILAMQKSDATLIDTAIRDSMTLKIVLGNAEDTTYTTAFGAGVPIPDRNYAQGDGVFTEPSLAPQPKLVQFPTLNFDVQTAAKGTRGV